MNRRETRLYAAVGIVFLIGLGVFVSLVEIEGPLGILLFAVVVAVLTFVIAALWFPTLQDEAKSYGLTPVRFALAIFVFAAAFMALRVLLLNAV